MPTWRRAPVAGLLGLTAAVVGYAGACAAD